MENLIVPTQAGQICKTLVPLENEREGDVYIITGDFVKIAGENHIEAVSLKDLQRNVKDPSKAEKKLILLNNLTAIGDNLEDYISAWNDVKG